MQGNNKFHLVRLISILLVSQSLATHVRGQETSDKNNLDKFSKKPLISRIEFLAGPSITYPRGDKEFNKAIDPKIGYVANVGLIHVINSKFSINLKCRYETKGFKLTVNNNNLPPGQTIKGVMDDRLNYLTVSLLPRYFILEKHSLYIGGGPYLAYVLNGKQRREAYQNGLLVAQSTTILDSKDYKQRFDAGITGLIGYDLRVSKRITCSIQFLYNLGFTDLKYNSMFPIRNNTFSLNLGLSMENHKYLNL